MSHSQRQEILAQARRLFLEQGYHGLAMRSIAEAVGVTKAALYYHFKDKEELFLAVVTDYLDAMEVLLDRVQAQAQAAPQRLQQLVQGLLELPAEQRALTRLVSQEIDHLSPAGRQALEQAYHSRFIFRIAAVIETGMQRGELRRMPVMTAVWALLGMLYPFVYPTHTTQTDPQDLQAVISLYLQGIAK